MAKKCCDYSAGMLKHAIEFQSETPTSDGAGGHTKVWAAITDAPTRAHARQLSGSERYASERREATNAVVFVVRYSPLIDETHRVLFKSKLYNISNAHDVEFAGKWLEVTASGGVAI